VPLDAVLNYQFIHLSSFHLYISQHAHDSVQTKYIQNEVQITIEHRNRVLDSVIHMYIAGGTLDLIGKLFESGYSTIVDIILDGFMTIAVRQ
jgi:hypothetical protein